MIAFFQTLVSSLWTENSTAGRLIVALIFFLALRAWFHGRRHLRRYRREGRQLGVVATDLAALCQPLKETAQDTEEQPATEAGAVNETGDGVPQLKSLARPNLQGSVDVSVLRARVDQKSLIGERLAAIEKMRLHQVKVNLRTLQRLTLAREDSEKGLRIPSFTAGIALMLGIFGTFLGLSIMVQEIQFSLPQDGANVTLESWTDAFHNIRTVLAGIKTAFSTSLAGMACAIWLTFLASRVHQTQAAYLECLERFTAKELLPATVPATEDESLLEKVSLQLENSFLYLEEVFAHNRDVLQDLTGTQASFVDIVEEIRLITKNEASRDLERVVGELTKTNQSVLAVVEKLPGIVQAVESAQERLFRGISPWRQTVGGLTRLWNDRFLGFIPGAVVLVVVSLVFLFGVLRLAIDFI